MFLHQHLLRLYKNLFFENKPIKKTQCRSKLLEYDKILQENNDHLQMICRYNDRIKEAKLK